MPGTIVCAVTNTAGARAAAGTAAALAARLGARLVLVTVVAGSEPRFGREAAAGGDTEVARRLEAVALGICAAADARVVLGSRVDGIAQVAADEGADAIVLGSRSRGARGRQLRCTLARELEAAVDVPVLVAPPATRDRSGRRLAGAGAAR
jgi:nucleotide-binding universal stress UspA family protein